MNNNTIPINKAMLWILLSILCISGSFFMGWLYYLHMKKCRLQDEQYRIIAIIQHTPQTESLKTNYLAELLNLSVDQPSNLYGFDSTRAEQILLKSSLLKQISVKKIFPSSLYIQYEMRIPIAYLGDYTNTAIDKEGYIFPCRPFFTPKRLPVFYLGLEQEKQKWGNCIQEKSSTQLAFAIWEYIQKLELPNCHVQSIDVSQAYSDHYGKRQVIVVLKEWGQEQLQQETHKLLVLLRLHPLNFKQNLVNFQTLEQSMKAQNNCLFSDPPTVVDLRIPQLAFIKK
jgi:hypothetical protein